MTSEKSPFITAMILTKNEEKRLPLIFENLRDFAEIIVFDGGSTDRTEAICEQYGVKFVKRPPENREIVGEDIRVSMSQIKTPYVLYVNCSHYYPSKLLQTFKEVASAGNYHAVYHDIVIYTYGKVVHRPFFRRRSSATNFYRLDAVNFKNTKVHNEAPVELPNNLKFVTPASDEYSVHLFRDYNVEKAESNHGFYSTMDANHRFKSGIRTSSWLIIYRPIKYFLYQYIRCGSVLHGIEGFIYTLLYAQLELSIQMKLWELQNDQKMDSIVQHNLDIRKLMHDERR
jgi:glycosyltransferase involved in cell wall biosynthesis